MLRPVVRHTLSALLLAFALLILSSPAHAAVYPTSGTGVVPRVEVAFVSGGVTLSRQIVRANDTLVTPSTPASSTGGRLVSWNVGSTDISPYLDTTLTQTRLGELAALGTQGEHALTQLTATATFAETHVVRVHQYPHDQVGDPERAGVLAAALLADGQGRVSLSQSSRAFVPVSTADDVSLAGWLSFESDDPSAAPSVSYATEGTVEGISADLDLYPRLASGFAVMFDTSGAPAVDGAFVPLDDGAETGTLALSSLPAASYTGYELEGWYRTRTGDSAGEWEFADKVTEDLTVSEPTTLYARWTPRSDIAYTVAVWVEGSEGAPGEGAYSIQSTTVAHDGITGGVVGYESAQVEGSTQQRAWKVTIDGTVRDTSYSVPYYHVASARQASLDEVRIAGDGSTVVNLYLERDYYAVSFRNASRVTFYDAGNVKWGHSNSDWYEDSRISNIKTRWRIFYDSFERTEWTNIMQWMSMRQCSYEDGRMLDSGAHVYFEIRTNETYLYSVTVYRERTYQDAPEENPPMLVEEDGSSVDCATIRTLQATKFDPQELEGYYLRKTLGFTVYKNSRETNYPDRAYYYGEDHTDVCSITDGGIYMSSPYTYSVYYRLRHYAVRFFNLGDEGVNDITDVPYTKPLADLDPRYASVKTGPYGERYEFAGWFTSQEGADNLDEAQRFDFSTATMPSSNLALYAGWREPSFAATFNSNGGTVVGSQEGLVAGDRIVEPAAPTKSVEGVDYTFVGWYKNERLTIPWNFNADVVRNADVTLYAKWVAAGTYTLTYHDVGGTSLSSLRVFAGATVELSQDVPQMASVAGEELPFLGWSTVASSPRDVVGNAYVVDADTHLYAVYAESVDAPAARTVTLHTNYPSTHAGADATATLSAERPNASVTLPTIAAAGEGFGVLVGHTFAGWASDPSGPVLFSPEDVVGVPSDSDVYAAWTPVQMNEPEVANAQYTGADITPQPVVTDKLGNALELGRDYTLSYEGNHDVGAASVTITPTASGLVPAADPVTVNFQVTRAPLTVSANDKQVTYGDAPANAGVSYAGLVGGETSAVLDTSGLSFAYNKSEDGTGAAYVAGSDAGSYRIICSGVASDNYEISYATGTLAVEPRTVGLSWSDDSPVYTGSSVSYAGATVTGAYGSDVITVGSYDGPMSATDVKAEGYTVYAIELAGSKADNYQLPADKSHTWYVLQADNSVSASIQGWTYGQAGSTPAAEADFGASTATFSYADSTDGPWSSAVPTSAGTHYVRAQVAECDNWEGATSSPVSFEVAHRPVSIAGVGAADKSYDGSPSASYTGTPALAAVEGQAASGPVADDDVGVVAGDATFADAHAGEGKDVAFSGWTLSGATAVNYELVAQPASVKATIEQRDVTLVWSDTSFTYDAASHVPHANAGNLLSGDFCDVEVGESRIAAGDYTASALSLSNGDYRLPAERSVTFSIARAQLTLTARDWAISYSDLPANDGYDMSGFVGGETWQSAGVAGEVGYSYTYQAGDGVGTYAINLDVSGLSAPNYDFSAVPGSLQVGAAQNSWTTEPSIQGWVAGQDPSSPVGIARFGDVAVTYAPSDVGPWSEAVPSVAGAYVARFVVAPASNWSGLEALVPLKVVPDTLSYLANSAFVTGTTPAAEGVTGQPVTVAEPGFSWARHEFTGWNTAADGSGTTYGAGDPYVLTAGEDVLYAQWDPTGELAYDGNGATAGAVEPQLGSRGTVVSVSPCGFVRTGYEFTGWNTAADGSGKGYAPSAEFTLSAGGDVLYAQWRPTSRPDRGRVMYRLYNPNSGEHFYTASVAERDAVAGAGWTYEGVGWKAPIGTGDPVYRLYNSYAGDHHYTLSPKERDTLVRVGWTYEGVGWLSAPREAGVAVWRQYNPNAIAGAHNFTTSMAEHVALCRVGWRGEGIAWYGIR